MTQKYYNFTINLIKSNKVKFNYNVHGRMLMNLYPILTRFKKQNNITDRTLGLLLFLYGENIHTTK